MAGGGQRLIDLPDEQFARLRQQMRYVNPPVLMEVIRLFNQAGADLKLGLQPQLPLELAIVESILKLQEQGMTGAPHVDLALPERPQPPQIVREPRVVKLPPQEVQPSIPLTGEMGNEKRQTETHPLPPSREGEPLQAPVASPVPLGRGESEAPLTESTHDTDESQERDILWDGGSLAEANGVYETDEPDIEEVEEEPLAPSVSLDWWQANWEPFKQFLAKQGEQGQRAMLRLKWGDPIAATADTLTLGFGYTMHLEKVQKPEEKSVIERALGKFSNHPIKLISQQISRNAPPATPTKTNRFEVAAADPVVQEALRQGGQIVDVLTPKE
jgi:hypothetical protein